MPTRQTDVILAPCQQTDLDVVILAGGLGTRLRSVLPRLPKVLAPVNGRPFITYLLDHIASCGLRRVTFCLGYRASDVIEALGDRYGPLTLAYSVEESPLDTAGAVRNAAGCLRSDPVLVLNGDSLSAVRLDAFVDWFLAGGHEVGLALTYQDDCSRFGGVVLGDGDRIVSFEEKSATSRPGWINAGIYLLRRGALLSIPPGGPQSFERQFFPQRLSLVLHGFRTQGAFIDIGTPASLLEAGGFCDAATAGNPSRNLP